ncbi:MAG TPA: ChbG/HpnK family deacetylase [Ramlibacter sp.]|nr:ChbG/HpnK family deacetylase [Ramlibacter sp.]
MKRIAICIDDYGLHPAVDDAVLRLVEEGRVTATSCMVGAPAWAQDAPRLKPLFEAGRVDAGVHMDFTEYPIDASMRRPLNAWMVETVLHRVDVDAIRREIRLQLDRFEQAMGRAPAHVDGHQHVHQFPVVRDVLVEELERRYGSSKRPWLRSTNGAARWRLKGRVIEAMGARALARLAQEHGFAQNRTLLGVYDFAGGAPRFRSLLQMWLARAEDGDLLMCHVATGDVPGDEIAAARVDEFEVFSQDGFDGLVADAGVTVAPMTSILARAEG